MAFSDRDRKRVRIQSGHQERIIERRSSRPRRQRSSRRRTSRRASTKRRTRKMRSAVRRAREQPHWNCKTHRPTVAQVVYQYLERASTRGATKRQKSNASKQFRQFQRRKHSKRLTPDIPKRIKPNIEAMEIPAKEEYRFPYSKLPSQEGEKSIEKCIYEVLSFGTMLGLLVPADEKGMTFRVSSDIALFKDENKKDQVRKRKFDKLLEEKYCECGTKFD